MASGLLVRIMPGYPESRYRLYLPDDLPGHGGVVLVHYRYRYVLHLPASENRRHEEYTEQRQHDTHPEV